MSVKVHVIPLVFLMLFFFSCINPSGPNSSSSPSDTPLHARFDYVHLTNADASGIWSNGTTTWVADTTDAMVYAYNANGTRNWAKDITLATANSNPGGIWSDGTTLWVLNTSDKSIYTYTLSTGASLSNSTPSGLSSPQDIWLNDTHIWVSDSTDNKLYAYTYTHTETTLSFTGDSGKDIALSTDNTNARGIWSDGTIMWVGDTDTTAYAYHLNTGLPYPAKDINLQSGNVAPVGLWFDGTTMQVADPSQDQVYAYTPPSLSNRDSSKDISFASENSEAKALWGTSDDLYVVDDGSTEKVFAYDLDDGTRNTSVEFNLTTGNDDPVGVTATATIMWITDSVSEIAYAYTIATGSSAPSGTEVDNAAITGANANADIYGVWNNSSSIWVADDNSDTLHAFTATNPPGGDSGNSITLAGDNADPGALWGDSTNIWVLDRVAKRLFVYAHSDGTRNINLEFHLHSDNANPAGIWSDETTIWVGDSQDNKAYAYTLPTTPTGGTYVSASDWDFSTELSSPKGLWSDETTAYLISGSTVRANAATLESGGLDSSSGFSLTGNTAGGAMWANATKAWVVEGVTGGDVRGYTFPGGSHDSTYDLTLHADNNNPSGLWSNGTNFWVADSANDTIFVYQPDGTRVSANEFTHDESSVVSQGLWGDGTTLWVADDNGDEVIAYNISVSPPSRNSAKDITLNSLNDDPRDIWSDGESLIVLDNSEALFFYELP